MFMHHLTWWEREKVNKSPEGNSPGGKDFRNLVQEISMYIVFNYGSCLAKKVQYKYKHFRGNILWGGNIKVRERKGWLLSKVKRNAILMG